MTASLLAVIAAAPATAQSMDELVAAAKAEGMLTTIALPHDWCGYGDVIAGFKAKYPEITVNELNPDAGSADEIEAIKANQGNTGPQAPDVIDVGLAFGPASKDEGLTQPYKVATWDSIPDSAKDADGYWYGDYYGVMSFLVNKDLVTNTPMDWSDLLKPEYAGQVALAGDPRASNQAILAVLSAGLANGGASGTDAGEKGLEYFAEVNKAGNFVPVIGKAGTVAQGATPIVAMWDYNALAAKDTLAGNPPVEVDHPRVRHAGRCLCAGDQRLCTAPQRRQTVDGVPLFRRGSAGLAERLLPPDPLQRHGRSRRGPAGTAGCDAAGGRLCQGLLPDAG